MSATATLTAKEFRTDVWNDWCPGCGDFGILSALHMALAQLGIPPHRAAVFSGIGCSGKTPHYINAYGFHTLHGRVIPSATGGKLANHGMEVIALGGDGDGYGIGAGYFINAGRRNLDFTYIVYNNGVYGLTKGQASPTLRKGLRTKSMPEQAIIDGINPIALALGAGYTFVARGYALETKSLANLLAQAIQHRGTALVDVLQTCPTYNDIHTKDWYAGEDRPDKQSRIYKLDDIDYDPVVHNPSDQAEIVAKKAQALVKSYENGEKIPVGVFYVLETSTMEDELAERNPEFAKTSLAEADFSQRDITPLFDELA